MQSGAVLFLIPARGGSKRVPGKNLRLVGGIPLVGWAARLAQAAAHAIDGGPHRIVCSTDDDAIAAAASLWGAEVLDRPAALATDDATSAAVAIHALDALETAGRPFATLVLLQPTSPLCDPAGIVAAVARHRAAGGDGVTSVVAGHPVTWHHGRGADGVLTPAVVLPGEDVRLAGAFYVVSPGSLRASGAFVEPGRTLGIEIPQDTAIDIDEPADLIAAEATLAARAVRPVPVGATVIGRDRTFVIAEAGVNHNGDVALALRLVDAAADVGADAVKFQTFDPDALAGHDAPTAEYQRRAGGGVATQRQLLRDLVLPPEAWPALRARAIERGLVFLSTPFDDGSADLLEALGVPAFKVGSGDISNTPFLARLARRGRPMLVSTGTADMREVAAAVDTIRANGDVPLALLHCVSSYPAAPADANLRAIETMRRAFGVPVGWSDHTPGIETALAAVALGAALIEKHLTLDRSMAGPDHAASLEPDAFRRMVEGIRDTEAALGDGVKAPVAAELSVATVARKSLYWRTSRPEGHVVAPDDLDALRPGTGIPPSRLDAIVGRRTARAVAAGIQVQPTDIEGLA